MSNLDSDPLVRGIKLSADTAIMLMTDHIAMLRRRAATALLVGAMCVVAASFAPGVLAEAFAEDFPPQRVNLIVLGLLFGLALFECTLFLWFRWLAAQQQRELAQTIQQNEGQH